LSTTVSSPCSIATRASGAWESFAVAMTAKSCSEARSQTSSAEAATRAPGKASRARAARASFEVTIVVSSSPGVAAISGA
jgi:hypothetical protein